MSEHVDGYDLSSVEVSADGAPLAVATVAILGADIDAVVNAAGAPAFSRGWRMNLLFVLSFEL